MRIGDSRRRAEDGALRELAATRAELDSWVKVMCQQTDKIDELVSQVADLQFNHDVMEVRALQAEAEVQRVRELHVQRYLEGTALGTTCTHDGHLSPCPTIAALEDVPRGEFLVNGQKSGSIDNPWITFPPKPGWVVRTEPMDLLTLATEEE